MSKRKRIIQGEEAVRARARAKAWYYANKERALANVAAYRETNAEKIRARREANIEAIHKRERAYDKLRLAAGRSKERAGYMKAYYEANKEQVQSRARVYYENHIEEYAGYSNKRRALKRSAPGKGWTRADVEAQFSAQHGKCYYCGCELGKKYHRDHIIPLAKGGAHCRSNLALACAYCNLSKKDRDPQEFAGILL